ncbi:hypothetical protein EDC04DRAFT_2611225 [Pisolithus marmoratus]|nr:hypothetical protein EDC04DRAFT_2611225 [Pisolithus marmoratus]
MQTHYAGNAQEEQNTKMLRTKQPGTDTCHMDNIVSSETFDSEQKKRRRALPQRAKHDVAMLHCNIEVDKRICEEFTKGRLAGELFSMQHVVQTWQQVASMRIGGGSVQRWGFTKVSMARTTQNVEFHGNEIQYTNERNY